MSDETIIRFQIEASSLDEMRTFTDEVQPDLGCRAIPRRVGEKFVMDAYLPETRLRAARDTRAASGVSLRTIENATEIGRERQQEVGEGNRFAVRGGIPRGLGRKE